MDQSNFEKDLQESEEAFVEQFDRNSANYHNGNPTAVPVGGQRVPDSMPTMYPEQVNEIANQNDLQNYFNPQEQDFGPEYTLLMHYKEQLDLLKKALNKLTAHHEALLRNQELKNKNPTQTQKYSGLIDSERGSLQVTMAQVEQYTQYILNQDRFKTKYGDLLQVLTMAGKQYETKEDLFQFGTLVKTMTTVIFKDNQKLTEEIKAIKKQKK